MVISLKFYLFYNHLHHRWSRFWNGYPIWRDRRHQRIGQQFNDATHVNMSSLHIILWNANGLLSCKLELDKFLTNNKIDIALVTETHSTERYAFLSSRNYRVTYAFHPLVRHRAVLHLCQFFLTVYSRYYLCNIKNTDVCHSYLCCWNTTDCCIFILLTIF